MFSVSTPLSQAVCREDGKQIFSVSPSSLQPNPDCCRPRHYPLKGSRAIGAGRRRLIRRARQIACGPFNCNHACTSTYKGPACPSFISKCYHNGQCAHISLIVATFTALWWPPLRQHGKEMPSLGVNLFKDLHYDVTMLSPLKGNCPWRVADSSTHHYPPPLFPMYYNIAAIGMCMEW